MEMESTRRSFDKSISREQPLKKPRLTEGHAVGPHLSSGDRAGLVQRCAVSNSDGGLKVQREQESVRGPYQQQPGGQLHQELVNQYKTALSELTFNSKPIITNLTIIAGENLQSAKAIAATVCSNILEVPSEQKLPSLYLLDSIVKNIGRDYIKCFASRLPEVFCKVYKQVDPSIHQGMRHLFGTWKGVFPPHTLQMIEKELGFTTTANGSSSGKMSRTDPHAQCPSHSIHVNPRYLETRQRLQTSRARGSGSDTSGSIISTHEDVEASERTTSINSGRLSGDPYAKYKDKVNEAVQDKSSSTPYVEAEYGSSVPGSLGMGGRNVSENFKDQGLDISWCESGSNATGKAYNVKNGLHASVNSNSRPQLKQNFASTGSNGVSQSWKNSEEEEFVWDGMIGRPTGRYAADTPAKDNSITDSVQDLEFDRHFQRSQGLHDIGSSVPDETLAGSLSGTQLPLSLPEQQHRSGADMLLENSQNISTYAQGYSNKLRSLSSAAARKPIQSQQCSAPLRGQNLKFSEDVVHGLQVSLTHQASGAATTHSGMHQCPPSPSLSAHNQSKLSVEQKPTSTGPPKDPRRPPRQRNAGSYDQVSQDSQSLSSRDVYESSTKKFPTKSSQASSGTTAVHSLQQRKHLPSSQKRKHEQSSDGGNLLAAQISGSGSRSMEANLSSVDSSGQLTTSSLLTAEVKSAILGSASLTSLTGCSYGLSVQEVGLESSSQGAQPPLPSSSPPSSMSSQPSNGNIELPGLCHTKLEHATSLHDQNPFHLAGTRSEQATSMINSTFDPVSSLLSSLAAKGLISSSKSDSLSSASSHRSNQTLDRARDDSKTRSTPDSATPMATGKPVISITDEPSASKIITSGSDGLVREPSLSITNEPSASKPIASVSDGLFHSRKEMKNLIGAAFRSRILRTLHSAVLEDLHSDLPYQCSTCGLRLKLQESFDRHMEWHALRIPERNPLNNNSRSWYANVVNWVVGDSPSDHIAESGVTLESCEPMVPADETQCVCILCGELFDDFYSQERNGWMFKGAACLSDSSSESHERIGTMSSAACLGPIVHVHCMSQDFIPKLGLA